MMKSILKYLNDVYGSEKRYGFKETEKSQALETDRYIELENGDCINLQGYNQRNRSQSNKIKSYNITYAMDSFISFFGRIQNIFLLIVMIICSFMGSDDLPTAYSRPNLMIALELPLLFDLLITLLKEAFYFQRILLYDTQINNKNTCLKLIRFKNADFKDKLSVDILEKTTWGALQVGDIVFLAKDEYCPADLLILDMWESKCTADTSYIDDSSEATIKYSPILTSIQKNSSIKGNLTEYRRILTGRIDIKKTEDIQSVYGYVSLKKDPISEKIGVANLLQKYSQVKYTDWLVGIVVLSGNDSFSFKQASLAAKEKQRLKPSFFRREWDVQSIIQIIMICFFSLIVIILRISLNCFKSMPFKGQMVPIAIDFILTFPSYCSIINQFVFCIYNINKGLSPNSEYFMNYLTSFSELADSTHIIFNSLRIQNQMKSIISSFCLRDRFFKLSEISPSIIKSPGNLVSRLRDTYLRNDLPTLSDLSQINSPASTLFGRTLNLKKIQSATSPNPKIKQFQLKKEETLSPPLPPLQLIESLPEPITNSFPLATKEETHVRTKRKHSLTKIIELDSKTYIGEDQNGLSRDLGLKTSIRMQDSTIGQNINKTNNMKLLDSKGIYDSANINQSDRLNLQSQEQKTSSLNVNNVSGPEIKPEDHNLSRPNILISQLNSSEFNITSRREDNDASFNRLLTPMESHQQLQIKPENISFSSNFEAISHRNISELDNKVNMKNNYTGQLSFKNDLSIHSDSSPFNKNTVTFTQDSPRKKSNEIKVDKIDHDSSHLLKQRRNQINSIDNDEYHQQFPTITMGNEMNQIEKKENKIIVSELNKEPEKEDLKLNDKPNQLSDQQLIQHNPSFFPNFKTLQTGKTPRKNLEDDFLEYDLKSASSHESSCSSSQSSSSSDSEDGCNIQIKDIIVGSETDVMKASNKPPMKILGNGNTRRYSDVTLVLARDFGGNQTEKLIRDHMPSEVNEKKIDNLNAILEKECESQEDEDDDNAGMTNQPGYYDQENKKDGNILINNNITRLRKNRSFTNKPKGNQEKPELFLDQDINSKPLADSADFDGKEPSNFIESLKANPINLIANRNKILNPNESKVKGLSISTMLPQVYTSLRPPGNDISKIVGKVGNTFEGLSGFQKAITEKSEDIQALMMAMALCHETKTKVDREKAGSTMNNIHLDKFTENILEFTQSHDVTFECSCQIAERLFYIILNDHQRIKVQVLFRFTFQESQSMVLIAEQDTQSFLLIRHTSTIIPNYLQNSISSQKKQKLEQLIGQMKEQGERIIFYSKKELSEDQLLGFQNSIRAETSSREVEEILQKQMQFSEEDPSPIQMLGFIGLKEDCDQTMKDTIGELRRLNKKIWVLTCDKQESVIESCYNYKVLAEKQAKIVDFSSANFEELMYKTRSHLEVMSQMFSNKKDGNEGHLITQNQLTINGKQMSQFTPTGKIDHKNNTPDQTPSGANQLKGGQGNQAQVASNPSNYPLLKKSLTVAQRRGSIQDNSNKEFTFENSKKEGTFIEENEIKEYSVIICGESLNIIRSNEYLWNHFCLIIFYANSVVGFELCDEQKSFLGNTMTDKFKSQHQRVVNVLSSLNDSERLNYNQVGIHFENQNDQHPSRSSIIRQLARINSKDPESFLNILFRESRLQMEVMDEIMYMGVYRSYLLAFSIILWNVLSCACNVPLFDPVQIILFNGVQLIVNVCYYIYRKNKKFFADKQIQGPFLRAFYSRFSETRQQLPMLNMKIVLQACVDSLLIFFFFTTFYEFQNGISPGIEDSAILLQWGIYLASFCQVFDLHFLSIKMELVIFIIVFSGFVLVDTYATYGDEIQKILRYLFESLYFFNVFLFISFYAVKSIFTKCFFVPQPFSIIGISKYVDKSRKESNHIKITQRHPQRNQSYSDKSTNNNVIQLYQKKQFDGTINAEPQQQPSQLTLDGKKLSDNNSNNSKTNNTPIIQIKTPPKQPERPQIPLIDFSSNIILSLPSFPLQLPIHLMKKYNPAQVIRSIFVDKEMDIILSSMLMQEDINLNQTQMSRWTLKFSIKEIEQLFDKSLSLLIKHSNRIFYVINFIAFDIGYEILVLSKVTNEFSASGGTYIVSYAITSSIVFILTALTLTRRYQKSNILKISISIAMVRSLKFILLNSSKQILTYPTELVMHIAVATSCFRFSHTFLFIQGSILFLVLLILTETDLKKWNLDTFFEAIGYVSEAPGGNGNSSTVFRMCFYVSYLILFSLFIAQKYSMSLTLRNNYLSEHNLFKATMKVKDILSILLPKFIREKIETMKQGQYKVAEKQEEVVIVFCDICNFDDLIFSEKTGIVRILDKLYRQFDIACQQNGLQKIETVGKTYLAAAGITDVEKLFKSEGRFQNVEQAKRALLFAFDLQKIVKSSRLYIASNKSIIIKVGIHLGPAISGVIGYHKPQFSLIGDTVNTTSRVCSTGLSDMITISSEVYAKVRFNTVFKFIERKVEAKGKGTITTYQVFDRKTFRTLPPQQQHSSFLQDLVANKQPRDSDQTMSQLDQFRQFSQAINTTLQNNQRPQEQKLVAQHTNEFPIAQIPQQSQDINKFIAVKSASKITLDPSPIRKRSSFANSNSATKRRSLNRKKTSTVSIKPSRSGDNIAISNFDTGGKDKKNTQQLQLPQQPLAMGQSVPNYSRMDKGSPKKDFKIELTLNVDKSPIMPRKGGRMLKKASSFTIVGIKPHFQQDGRKLSRAGSGRSDKLEPDLQSPVSPPKNELINKIEGELAIHVELEPETIQLPELKLSVDKLQQIQILYSELAVDKVYSKDESGTSAPRNENLRLGLCIFNDKRSAEQKQLQIEFSKSIQKQQLNSVTMEMGIVSIYFLLKVILVANFVSNQNKNFNISSNTSALLPAFTSVTFILLALPALAFSKIYSALSWDNFKNFLRALYLTALLFTLLQDIELDSYMKQISSYNISLENSSSLTILAVVNIILPTVVIICLEIQLIVMVFASLKCFSFLEKIVAFIISLVVYFIYAIKCGELEAQAPFFLILIGVIHLRIQYQQIQNEVRSFNNMKTLEVKKNELDQLLNNLLPKHVLKQFLDSMKKEIPLVCEELDDVTLLFADIAGFTKYSSTTDPTVVVNMLRKLFTDFDDHCLSQNVFKLYTIGDCYVCFGLTNKNDRNPAQEAHNVIRFAFDMINIIENVRHFTNCDLQMRIGVHTGKLFGGIVGTEIVRYDVYGVDVIIGNKMESNGESGRVMVSEYTKKLLEENFPDEFEFSFKDTVHIKQANKDIDCFLVDIIEDITGSDDVEDQPQSQDQQSPSVSISPAKQNSAT